MALVDGEKVTVSTQRLDNEVIVTVGEVKAVFGARNSAGEKAALSADGGVSLEGGGTIDVRAEGLAPESDAEGLLYSEPTRLGTAQANDAGRLEHSFAVPGDIAGGNHRFVIRMKNAENRTVDLALGVVTVGGEDGVGLAAVVLVVLGIGIGFALFLPAALKRRRGVAGD